MKIKLFLIQLKKVMEKLFPTLTVDFFVSQRNRYVHIGLNIPLHSTENLVEVLQFTENLWSEEKTRTIFLLSADIQKSDYLLMKKEKFFRCCWNTI